MRSEEWSASRIAAALGKLEDTGQTQPKMARLAGVSQSTVNRWSRGRVRPGYDAVRRLAAAVWRQHPDLARELVEASGYAWAEPDPATLPLIAPEVEADIRRLAESDEEAELLLEAMRRRRMEKLRTTGGAPAA